MWNDPEVQRGLAADHVHPRPPKFADELRDWVNKDAFYAVIENKETCEFMGTTCIWILSTKNRDGMVAIGLLPRFWNKGYGTEALGWVVDYAFKWLALHRVSLSVFESNKGAIGSYKNIGFAVEGVKRKANWADGKWEDVYDMCILDEDWALKQVSNT
ncbi:hypothetical protein HWV62_41659 [Athelia sp. TMB]|nr:hypothetical protein HWV62_45663 [Athelia sp. TMB]KAF7979668.1 hypothetical protein HWV62_41659 [Athelia sp. TMB]